MRAISMFLLALVAVFLPVPASATVSLLALGDSLTAGYGLDQGHAMPDILQVALQKAGKDVKIINAGVSGDTAAQGAARLDWALTPDIKGLILELGANDALRGLPPEQTDQALRQIMDKAKAKGLPVLILGMKAPPNLGADYRDAYDAIFPRLAKDYGAQLYPFYLEGVAAQPSLNQADGMHPNDQGVAVIVTKLLPVVEQFLSALP